MMTAAKAKKEGKVWVNLSVSGGKTTPLLGDCRLWFRGPVSPDNSFLIYMLAQGKTVTQARKLLKEAKAK